MNASDIVWPIAISESLKHKMLSISQTIDNVKAFEVSTDYWHVNGLFYINKGLFTVGYTAEDLNVTVSAIVGAQDWLGINSLFDDGERVVHSVKLAETELIYFPRDKLEALSQQEPSLFELFYYLSKSATRVLIRSCLVCLHERDKRIAYTLARAYNKLIAIDGKAEPVLQISQQQLSNIVGVSRPRVNETLKEFERQRIILVQRGKIFIEDIDGLMSKLDELRILMKL
jgi:CRP-like cAMP-binding protein